jgi:hypothetical protein
MFTIIMFPFVAALPLRWPFVGVVTILGTHALRDAIFAERFDMFYRLHGPQVLYFTTFLGIFLNNPGRLKDFFPRCTVDYGMLGFMVVMLISAVLNGDKYIMSNKYIDLFFKAMVLYFLLSRLTDSERRVLIVVFTLIVTTSYLVYMAWDKSRTKGYHYARPYSISSHHTFGIQLIMTLPLVATMIAWQARERVRLGRYVRFVLLALVPLYVLTGMRTQSRSSYLGLGVALFLLVWHYRRKWYFLVLASPVIAFALMHHHPRIFGHIESIWTHKTYRGRPDHSIGSRFRQMHTAMRIFQSRPILGIGPRQYFRQYLYWAVPEEVRSEGRYTMHCVPLLILSEEGLIGFFAYYVLMVGGAFMAAWRTVRLARARDRPELVTLAIVASGCLMGFIAWMAFSLGQPGAWTINIYAMVALVVAAENVALGIVREEAPQQAQAAQQAAWGRPPGLLPADGATEIVFS